MNPFERHGLTHLSASALNLYRDDPGAYVVRYLMGVRDEAGPGAWRGQAVEAALDQVLFGQPDLATKTLHLAFEEKAAGLADDKTAKERADLVRFFNEGRKAIDAFKLETPLFRQKKISIDLPGIEIPVIGFVDWEWADRGIDLKTTQRMPSSPFLSHVDQMAIYMRATGKPFSLLYLTPTKSALYEVTAAMAAEGMARIRRGALAVRSLLEKCATPEEAFGLFSPDISTYLWSPPMVEVANRIYGATP